RLVRTRMLGGVRGRGLAAPSYSIRLPGGAVPAKVQADAQGMDMGVTGRGRGPGALPACREDLFAGDPEPSGFSVSPFPGKIP
ncbi:hypothetical protein, partial [Caldibacillus debilis]|uniref:hypothetical protein n=1 Tax=Caldibacillus debilis TaxID=301148 RepID=UPI001F2ECB66